MAHFAQINENNIVIWVVSVSNEEITDENGTESEDKGINLLKSIVGEDTKWVQTSYNSNFRRQYASAGGIYDPTSDVFIDPKPAGVESFVLVDGKWYPPIPAPEKYTEENWPEENGEYTEAHAFYWNEESLSWKIMIHRPENDI